MSWVSFMAGSPTSWLGFVDSITSGADGSGGKRLFFISSENVDLTELGAVGFPNVNILHISLHGIQLSPGEY